MHLLLVGRVDPSSGHAAQQSTCQYFFRGSRMFIRWFVRFILVGCRDGGRSECLDNQPRIESNLIMMESEWMQYSRSERATCATSGKCGTSKEVLGSELGRIGEDGTGEVVW